MIVLYNILFFIAILAGFPLIILNVLASDKRRKTFLQRLACRHLPSGFRKTKRGEKAIWIHALSVGEVLSAAALVRDLKERFENNNIIFSVSTKTGFETAEKMLKEYADAIIYFPYDFLFSVKRVSRIIDPYFVILVESDIWPNFLFEMKKRNVPLFLVNARLSDKSFSGYGRFPFIAKTLFMFFSKICAQSPQDARRFIQLGVSRDKVVITGNIKFDQESIILTKEDITSMRNSLNIEPYQRIFLAGSTHPGEEAMLSKAFSRIKKEFADLVFIIAPRNPERAEAVCKIFKSDGFTSAPIKATDAIKPDVIIVDTIGILKRLYALADLAFIGGSLVGSGGHNPLEPAAFAKPIIFGYDMSNFTLISQMLVKSGGAVQVKDAAGIYKTAAMLLKDDKKAARMGKRALNVFYSNKGTVEKTLNVITENLQI